MFADNIDTDVNDNNEIVPVEEHEDDSALDDGDLNLGPDKHDKLQYKFVVFNPQVDMDDPMFKVGMPFADVKEMRSALRAYSVRNRRKITRHAEWNHGI